MTTRFTKIRQHSFRVHLLALVGMSAAGTAMFLAARQGERSWIWVWIGIFILGNLLELSLP